MLWGQWITKNCLQRIGMELSQVNRVKLAPQNVTRLSTTGLLRFGFRVLGFIGDKVITCITGGIGSPFHFQFPHLSFRLLEHGHTSSKTFIWEMIGMIKIKRLTNRMVLSFSHFIFTLQKIAQLLKTIARSNFQAKHYQVSQRIINTCYV